MKMRLISIYETDAKLYAAVTLYHLLKERDETVNISHRDMPSFLEHQKFIASRPYMAWYLIEAEDDYIGAVYITRDDEIGIFVFKKYQGRGYAAAAVRGVMKQHPRPRYLAHINPRNKQSMRMFERLGFRHLQNTYELIA